MKEIKVVNLKEHLFCLKNGEKIYFSVDKKANETIRNELLYLGLGLQSLDNLFKTCLLEENDILHDININKVIDKYTKRQLQFEKVKNDLVIKILGEENYFLLIKFGLSWSYNPLTNLFIINKGHHKKG